MEYELRTGGWNQVLQLDTPTIRAVWSPDGKSLAVSAAQGDAEFVNLYRIRLATPGPLEALAEAYSGQYPSDWSAAANAILFTDGQHNGTRSDISVLPLDGRQPHTLVATKGSDRSPVFSPDGRWFAYASAGNGLSEIFVQPLDQSVPAKQVTSQGGTDAVWSRDGRLYFLNPNGGLMKLDAREACGPARRVFPDGFASQTDWYTRAYTIGPDGRFLVIRDERGQSTIAPRIRVIVNWTEELRRLVPVPPG